MQAKGGGEIAFAATRIIDFGNQGGDGQATLTRNRAQFVPEGIFQREAGAVAVKRDGVFADHAEGPLMKKDDW